MKNTILLAAFAVLFGVGLMSCSMAEEAMGETADSSFLGGIFSTIFGLLKGFLPSLAAWEGTITMFSQRKRKHYVNAAKAIIPADKNMDIGGMIGSVGAALGVSHSSTKTKEQFDKEETV